MRAASCIQFFALAAVACALTGCTTWYWPLSSKWAMDDPDYAAKYSKPYKKDQPIRIAKQLVDARHLEGKSGVAFGAGGAGNPFGVSGELSAFAYANEFVEVDIGLTGMAGTGAASAFLGPEMRYRLVAPTRFSPFVGVGTFTGVNWRHKRAEFDGRDNDNDGSVDETGERKLVFGQPFFSVYPEVGMHLWANGTWRLTGSARYYVNSEGRDADFWYFGLALGRVSHDEADEEESDSETVAPLRLSEIEPAGFEQTEGSLPGADSMDQRPPSFLDNYLPSN